VILVWSFWNVSCCQTTILACHKPCSKGYPPETGVFVYLRNSGVFFPGILRGLPRTPQKGVSKVTPWDGVSGVFVFESGMVMLETTILACHKPCPNGVPPETGGLGSFWVYMGFFLWFCLGTLKTPCFRRYPVLGWTSKTIQNGYRLARAYIKSVLVKHENRV
jgi:hypothetical protein